MAALLFEHRAVDNTMRGSTFETQSPDQHMLCIYCKIFAGGLTITTIIPSHVYYTTRSLITVVFDFEPVTYSVTVICCDVMALRCTAGVHKHGYM
jgi:hypothetical protein